jgi:hypothetical protein
MKGFNELFESLKSEAAELIRMYVKKGGRKAEAEVISFLKESKFSLLRWTELLSKGVISPEEFEWLIQSKKDLLQLQVLRQSGLARIQIDKIKNGLLKLMSRKFIQGLT